MLRQLWSLIETTQTNLLLKLDDASLVQWILKQFKQKRSLDTQEADIISDYIYSRISLIRVVQSSHRYLSPAHSSLQQSEKRETFKLVICSIKSRPSKGL
jgi:hypothetical protein